MRVPMWELKGLPGEIRVRIPEQACPWRLEPGSAPEQDVIPYTHQSARALLAHLGDAVRLCLLPAACVSPALRSAK